MNVSALVTAAATGVSSMFVAGAAAENVHSFAFALYVGGTVFFFLFFIVVLYAGASNHESRPS